MNLSKSVDADILEAPVEWLGFTCRWRNNRIEARYRLLCPENQDEYQAASDQLVDRFRALHDRSDASAQAAAMVKGIVRWAAPSFEFVDRSAAHALFRDAGVCAGFEELPTFDQLEDLWL